MVKFAANLSMLYPDLDFLDRFDAAAGDGLRAVEFLFPYDYEAAELRRRLDHNGLSQALFNAPPGDWDAGERGVASLPGREREFRDGLERALEYAQLLSCPRVHVMAGNVPETAERSDYLGRYRDQLAWAADRAAGTGVRLLLEPLNHRDMPGYLLTSQSEAHALVSDIDPINLAVQLDLYHCQITEGDLTTTIERDVTSNSVAHIQIASVPDRSEPDHGEVDFVHILAFLDRLDYAGAVGLEYRPAADTSEGLQRFFTTIRERGVSV
ncbi:hydroxypyruvate isomerase [Microbacterium sp. Leaf288]|uniref:2-oxo-tetronate isomerase n=1 Tax=Microbacterium sp. Leaf288 TaxID=1736323 RepID=UPI0006F321C3|nr:2-oxo-tetronate isomerase [Microbacterium sp. Leaf288]KQP73237.1 hydroxypyruvate isomerase [Microbacterium sp. Leaf288]